MARTRNGLQVSAVKRMAVMAVVAITLNTVHQVQALPTSTRLSVTNSVCLSNPSHQSTVKSFVFDIRHPTQAGASVLTFPSFIDQTAVGVQTNPAVGVDVVERLSHQSTQTCPKGSFHITRYLCDGPETESVSNEPRLQQYDIVFGATCVADIRTVMTSAACSPTTSTATCNTNAVAVPTADQLRYQQHEIVGLTHFNMATFVRDGDPACDADNWNKGINSSNPTTFNPTNLNISNWIESYKAVGVKHGVLTAKHGCGFLLWKTNTTLPDGSEYRFGVQRSSVPSYSRNVLSEYSTLMQQAGLGHGFYYSTTNNFYMNRIQFKPAGALLPGQANVTDDEYNAIVFSHVRELWTTFGSLDEIWFDHGYVTSQKAALSKLLATYQPHAVGFGGQGLMPSPVKWVGTESGHPGGPIWSSGCDAGLGDPNATDFCPTGVDTYLQVHGWFYVPGMPVRPLSDMISVYHQSVGSNGVLEIDFAIDRTGNVDPTHAQRYKDLGDWARACYGTPVASTSGNDTASITLPLPAPTSVDRVMLQEYLSLGQRVRAWTVEAHTSAGGWSLFTSGTSIGHKMITMAQSAVTADAMRLNITSAAMSPAIQTFAVFKPCPSGNE